MLLLLASAGPAIPTDVMTPDKASSFTAQIKRVKEIPIESVVDTFGSFFLASALSSFSFYLCC